jgi:hypothetical protein
MKLAISGSARAAVSASDLIARQIGSNIESGSPPVCFVMRDIRNSPSPEGPHTSDRAAGPQPKRNQGFSVW